MTRVEAWQRGPDQLWWSIGQCHGAVTATVLAAASWATAAANWTQWLADETAWRKTIADVTGERSVLHWDSWCLRPQPVPVMSLTYASQLDALQASMDCSVLAWQAQDAAARYESPETVQQLCEVLAGHRREHRSRSFDGYGLEGQVLLRDLEKRRASWAVAVGDAAHFIATAGLPTVGLDVYVGTMRDLAEQAAQTLRGGYADLVAVMHAADVSGASELPADPIERTQVLNSAACALCAWMRELKAGGWSDEELETVLCELEPAHTRSVAEYRQMTSSL
ncbi:hypothetical protein AWC17_29955 [Mycobacterium nebraskense]|uniref:Uncharacterized protein n=1 Tax=Mycobacterium nebraskense TaxID=244292 RepID=A0A1X1ZTN6_9MYCO|nr:hypothetical protein [Mycobacterium nebraskense]ORW26896.1 hypothetical protein AWC17_29955 [Mycobacterium nebraskense]